VPEDADDQTLPPPTEGVRILGAEEAQAAVEAGADRPAPEEPRSRPEPPSGVRPAARFPLPVDRDADYDLPTPRATPAPPPASESSGSLPLPHWTEPPTGEVPQLNPDDTGLDDDDMWSSGSTPRFRSDAGDWSESDFGDDPLHDDTTALGALVDHPDVDDDEEFAAEVAARRARGRRTRARAPRATEDAAAVGASGAGAAGAAGAAAGGGYGAPPRGPRSVVGKDDLTTRVITGVVLAVIGLIAFGIGRAATAVLVTVIVAAAAFELYDGLRRAGFQPATLVGLLGAASMVGIAYNYGERAFPLVSAVVVGFTLFWYLAKVVHARPMVNTAVTLFGFMYVGILGGFAGLLLAYPDGVGMVIGLVLCAVAYDVVGYFVGSRMGRRPLAPDVSPNKTVEGLVAGMVASVFMGAIVAEILGLHPWNAFSNGILLGLVVAIFAPLGDLCESMIKRDVGLKDFGALLPGHGGVLDRFDAILFCLPAVYYLVIARGII
jgi:phosphatidate cytidylyltransferase